MAVQDGSTKINNELAEATKGLTRATKELTKAVNLLAEAYKTAPLPDRGGDPLPDSDPTEEPTKTTEGVDQYGIGLGPILGAGVYYSVVKNRQGQALPVEVGRNDKGFMVLEGEKGTMLDDGVILLVEGWDPEPVDGGRAVYKIRGEAFFNESKNAWETTTKKYLYGPDGQPRASYCFSDQVIIKRRYPVK